MLVEMNSLDIAQNVVKLRANICFHVVFSQHCGPIHGLR